MNTDETSACGNKPACPSVVTRGRFSVTRISAHCLLGSLLAIIAAPTVFASYGLYVGKNLTADGSVLLGGSGDEPSSHWLVVQPRQTHTPGSTITVGVTEDARFPGELTEIPQVPETATYISHDYTSFAGFPPPLTNGGLNEHQVAARDIWSPSREELVEMTPEPQTGPQYSDLSRIIMERAPSAREAVEIIGALIDEHGFSTYGGNSHLIADPTEGWILIQMAGGQGLWVAERLGPDDVRFSYPGYILEIPRDYDSHPDYMGSPNLIDFAIEQGWYDPESGEAFNVNDVYGNRQGRDLNDMSVIEERVRFSAPVTLEEMMAFIRDPRIAIDTTGYGQIAHLREGLERELAVLWAAPTNSSISPFVPYYIGIDDVPPQFKRHRYLSDNEASRFQDPDFQVQEGTQFAFRTYKRLMYLACERPHEYYPLVRTALEGFEAGLRDDQPRIEATARTLLNAGEPDLAKAFLTDYSSGRSMESLRLGNALVDGIEAHLAATHGLRPPEETVDRKHVWCDEPIRPERR